MMFSCRTVRMLFSFVQFSMLCYEFWQFYQKMLNWGFILILGVTVRAVAFESYPKIYGYVELIVIIFATSLVKLQMIWFLRTAVIVALILCSKYCSGFSLFCSRFRWFETHLTPCFYCQLRTYIYWRGILLQFSLVELVKFWSGSVFSFFLCFHLMLLLVM